MGECPQGCGFNDVIYDKLAVQKEQKTFPASALAQNVLTNGLLF
jgi:hypothetical protein